MTTSRAFLVLPVMAVLAAAQAFGGSREQFFLDEGTELYQAQKYEEAIAQFDQLLELDPANWSANYLTAASYLALYRPGSEEPKDKDYAEKGLVAFDRTLALAAPSPEERAKAEHAYLSFLEAIGDRDKALAYLEKQLRTRPDDLSLVLQIATLYQKKGEFATALKYFEKHATMKPTDKEAWYFLGVNCWARSYHGGSDLSQEERQLVIEKGIQALDKALEIEPDWFDALSYINLIYREKAKALAAVGKNADAADAYVKADEYMKRAIEVHKSLAAKAKAS